MWSSGPASQRHFSGKPWREQVITRQPPEEKRLTVACPMPRLAPLRIRVLRSSFGIWAMSGAASLVAANRKIRPCLSSRIEPRLDPGRVGGRAPEHDSVVQAVGPDRPELDLEGHHAVAVPMGGPRHVFALELAR